MGKSSFGRCRTALKPQGLYLSTELGWLGQNPALALWTSVFGSQKVLFPIPKETQADMRFFKQLAEAGQLQPVIDRCYPLAQIVDAYRYVDTGQKVGNVVIQL